MNTARSRSDGMGAWTTFAPLVPVGTVVATWIAVDPTSVVVLLAMVAALALAVWVLRDVRVIGIAAAAGAIVGPQGAHVAAAVAVAGAVAASEARPRGWAGLLLLPFVLLPAPLGPVVAGIGGAIPAVAAGVPVIRGRQLPAIAVPAGLLIPAAALLFWRIDAGVALAAGVLTGTTFRLLAFHPTRFGLDSAWRQMWIVILLLGAVYVWILLGVGRLDEWVDGRVGLTYAWGLIGLVIMAWFSTLGSERLMPMAHSAGEVLVCSVAAAIVGGAISALLGDSLWLLDSLRVAAAPLAVLAAVGVVRAAEVTNRKLIVYVVSGMGAALLALMLSGPGSWWS